MFCVMCASRRLWWLVVGVCGGGVKGVCRRRRDEVSATGVSVSLAVPNIDKHSYTAPNEKDQLSTRSKRHDQLHKSTSVYANLSLPWIPAMSLYLQRRNYPDLSPITSRGNNHDAESPPINIKDQDET